MASAWMAGGKIIVQNGKVILCDECPCRGCEEIESEQISDSTRQEPHYRVKIAHMKAKARKGAIYAYGSADDCLEVVGGGNTLFTDHDPDVDGQTHSYRGKLCDVPKNTEVDIYVWDTHYYIISWSGSFYFCYGDNTPGSNDDDEEFE